ncbi:arg8-vasotocin receptor-like protein [Lates japonicus]|uniref:Arg8-vasotocin receptor-like protein n=1 Tax=Lates japonicus TaxID=270547 RepID=A0AAD3M655_LATJO|nr:arg8-vasotocin receptor-like protein [Lates japonicus]
MLFPLGAPAASRAEVHRRNQRNAATGDRLGHARLSAGEKARKPVRIGTKEVLRSDHRPEPLVLAAVVGEPERAAGRIHGTGGNRRACLFMKHLSLADTRWWPSFQVRSSAGRSQPLLQADFLCRIVKHLQVLGIFASTPT